jgi:hypothetical protein
LGEHGGLFARNDAGLVIGLTEMLG